ncbi:MULTISPECIES: hypothetical protein [Caulobacter]|jgi:hypothetical protein|uniref:Uncharacterized protein n=1 Tax=Caulobacter vibrioides OR37 TaxID=1292034 RepID=R0EKZ2_CAUVI|nr:MULTISPECIES: hypothetical protein [Caulobacter]ENZ81777.1 hypothetical protein OR37_02374 [Caulobacter vibrioides OR37]MBQ1560197.1 hypothetical protein [Caulobacter sp.]
MKKILISLTAVSALAAVTLPAVASAQSLYDRRDNLERRIDWGVRSGQLTRGEAWRLRGELRDTARLERDYRRGGLTGWERADLDRRYDNISARIRYERHDNQYGYGYGRGPGRW